MACRSRACLIRAVFFSRVLLLRFRCLIYLLFVGSVTIFFYWMCGGFRHQNAYFMHELASDSQPHKIDTSFPVVVKRYCNFPPVNTTPASLAGIGESTLKLRGVILITRHGDRGPLIALPKHVNSPTCGLWQKSDVDLFDEYRMALSKVVNFGPPIHEAASAVFRSFNVVPTTDRCRPGQLTPVGAVQMIQLARRLRDYYRSSWSLKNVFEFHPYSTIFARTYQSAMAFVYGFTGSVNGGATVNDESKKWLLRSTDTTWLCSENWCACSNRIEEHRKEFHKELSIYTRTKTRDSQIRPMMEKIAAVLRLDKLEDPTAALDVLSGYACHREALPCYNISANIGHAKSAKTVKYDEGKTEKQCISKDWMARLFGETRNADEAVQKTAAGRRLSTVESMPILARIVDLADQFSTTPHTKFVRPSVEYYSAHDVTLRPILTALGVYDGAIPPYASFISFEIVEDTQKRKDLENQSRQSSKASILYRLLYNGQDVTSRIKKDICGEPYITRYEESVLTFCHTEILKEYTERYLRAEQNGGRKRTGDEWKKLCA